MIFERDPQSRRAKQDEGWDTVGSTPLQGEFVQYLVPKGRYARWGVEERALPSVCWAVIWQPYWEVLERPLDP
ncbi:MAG: hypothetical protein JO356_00885 [Acidobacteria bacterium]|nr:hypothetical protein [Acidobacteriota bacterium]